MRKTNPEDVNVDQLRQLGYERSDISLPTLVKWIIFLFVFVAFCSLTAWVIYAVFVPEIGEDYHANPQRFAKNVPVEPQLQALPKRDIKTFREEEDRILNSYGWADKNARTVHVPINRALEMVAERGLPSREPGPIPGTGVQPSPNITGGLSIHPGESGSVIPPSQPALPERSGPAPSENPGAPQ